MGGAFSSPSSSSSNPTHSDKPTTDSHRPASNSAMSTPDSNSSATSSDLDNRGPTNSEEPSKVNGGGEDDEGEKGEAGECGFCVFMKRGGCKDAFIAWEECVKEGEENDEDIVDKCYQATIALTTCMKAHSDYYEPVLSAEKRAEELATAELEREKNQEIKGAAAAESEKEKNQEIKEAAAPATSS